MNPQPDTQPGPDKRAPIPASLLAVFSVCAVFAALLTAYVLHANYHARMLQTSELLTNMGDEKLRLLDSWLTDRKRGAELIAWSPMVLDALSAPREESIAVARRTIRDVHQRLDFSSVYVLNTSSEVIVTSPNAPPFSKDRLWSGAMPREQTIFTIPSDSDRPATPQIAIVTPVLHPQDAKRLMGVLVCIIDPAALAAIIESSAEAVGVRTLFVFRKESGQVVYFTQLRSWPPLVKNWGDPAVEPALRGEHKFLVRHSTDGVKEYCITRTVPELGWGMITRIIASQVERPFLVNVIMSAVILVVATGLAILGVVAFGRHKQVHLLREEIQRRLKTEEILLQTEERWKKAFRFSPEAIAISTVAEGRYIEVNDNFLKLHGYQSREDVVGKTYAELNLWLHQEERKKIVEEVRRKGHVASETFRIRDRAGRILDVEISAESMQLQGEDCLMILGRDVTAHRQLEEQYRQAQKMEAVGRLAGGIAHDFNNMLAVISLSCELLLEEEGPNSAVGRRLAVIRNATERAAGLTRQLLAFSRQQVLQPQVTDINTIVSDTKRMLERVIGEDVEICLDLWKQPCRIMADAGQIVQILMNLAVNSRDAMPDGGKLTLSTRVVMLPPTVVHEGYEDKPHVVLSVADTGVGIDPEVQQRIFEPFFTTKLDGKGTGLGLATVYGIVNQSNGCIQLQSELGRGTTFHVYFPLANEASSSTARKLEEEIATGRGRILLVEDEREIRELGGQALASSGYEVETAIDGEDALAKFEAGASYDLLITDLTMPRMSGQALVAALHERGVYPRVLFMSAYSEASIHSQNGTSPEFLQKPFTRQDLLARVRHSVQGTK